MRQKTALFLITLLLILSAYLSSSYKAGIYNDSGNTIDTLQVSSIWKNETFTNIAPQSSIHFSVYAPFFNNSISIKVKQPQQILHTTFQLKGPMRGERDNQVSIRENYIKVGALAP